MNKLLITFYVFVSLTCSLSAQDLDPLEKVEQDQANVTHSSFDIFNRNIALNSLRSYTDVSSYKPGAFGFYAHDGDTRKGWVMHPDETGGMLKISWGLAVPVDRVSVSPLNPGAIQSFSLELYNGDAWETVAPENPEEPFQFQFPLRKASGLRISMETEGGNAGIAEVEVYNTRSTDPLPQYGSAELISAMREHGALILFEGSPYLYSRKGRELIRPKYAETCLADRWTEPVLESVITHLGGTVEKPEAGGLQVLLNDQRFHLETDAGVINGIGQLAQKAGLQFLNRQPLVIIGQGVAPLNREPLLSELEEMLGRNPYWVSESSGGEADAVVVPTPEQEGITYEWTGFRASAIPNTHIDAWLKYGEVKSVRTWRHAPRFMHNYIRPEETIETPEDFERYRDLVRNPAHKDRFKEARPEDVVAMRAFLNKYEEEITEEFSIYNKLGIELINATGPKNWPDDLHHDFLNWASTYMMTYYLAKNFGVAAHQFGNEPDWYFNQVSDEVVRRRLTLIADAVHSAIADVNRDHGTDLEAIFSAPVLAGDSTGRNARIMMRNLYTDYDGSKTEEKQFNLFNRHRYSGRPHQNKLEVAGVKQMMMEEAGETIPQVFTELNYSTARSWRHPETTFTNDTPEVFTSMASIWGMMMEEQGVYGIFIFKLNDPSTWFWKDTGRFSNTITYSMHREQDPGAEPREREQVTYGTKNFEMSRLFGKGFHGRRPLLKTEVHSTDSEYRSWTAFDAENQRYYIWSVQVNQFDDYDVEYDLSRLGLPAGALVTVETVSGARHGEVTRMLQVPEHGKFRIRQAPKSATLLTVHARPLSPQILYPVADATVVQGESLERNFGDSDELRVGRHSDSSRNRIAFLKFKVPNAGEPIERAILELQAQSVSDNAYDGGFLFRVYAVEEDHWSEETLSAANAPNVYRTVSSLEKVDLANYPVGHVTAYQTPGPLKVDATLAVREAQAQGRDTLTFVLIREIHMPGENTDDDSARISSREAGPASAPRLHLWK